MTGRAVVTGGGGFLGGAVVRALLEEGWSVASISRGHYPELEAAGVTCLRADLADPGADLGAAFAGADVVYHCAAKAGVWGSYQSYHHANVLATQAILEACLAAGVPKLVFTSSPSVCFDGGDHVQAGNDLPYPGSFLAAYPATKAAAEQLALSAHGSQGSKGPLSVVALRPHLIYGPGDPHLVPRILERARAGKLRIVGSGDNEVSLTHVSNAARGHLCAAAQLEPGAACGGQAYFLCDPEPVRLWTWVNELLERHGIPPVRRRVPAGVAYGVGSAMESLYHLLRKDTEPPMTRFVARQLATTHTYDTAPAARDLGFIPRPPSELEPY